MKFEAKARSYLFTFFFYFSLPDYRSNRTHFIKQLSFHSAVKRPLADS